MGYFVMIYLRLPTSFFFEALVNQSHWAAMSRLPSEYLDRPS